MLPEELSRPLLDDLPERRATDDTSPALRDEATVRTRKQATAVPPPEPAVAPSVAGMAAEAERGAAVSMSCRKIAVEPFASVSRGSRRVGRSGRALRRHRRRRPAGIGCDLRIERFGGARPFRASHGARRLAISASLFAPASRCGTPLMCPFAFQIRR